MDKKVVGLKMVASTAKTEPFNQTVDMLVEMLEDAKKGELRSIAITGVYHDHTISQGSSIEAVGDLISLIAGTDVIKARMVEDVLAMDDKF